MPYVFEATFTQPLLQKLDQGLIKGSEDWAKAITDAYINTIKTGLPQGVPPAIPAPSQLGVPFPMGADSFRTAKSREKMMYNVIYAYFYAKELKLDKGSIQGAIQTVKQLLAKIKHKQQQIRSLIQQIKLVTQQIANLPKLLRDIIDGLKQEIKRRIDGIRELTNLLENTKAEVGSETFQNIFRDELRIIDTVKNFKITDIAGIKKLTDFINSFGKQTNVSINNSLIETKNYVRNRLLEISKTFTEFGKAAIDPPSILNLLKSLIGSVPPQAKVLIQTILNKVVAFDNLVRLIQPKLEALNKRKNEKIKELRDKLQPKIAEFRKKLEEKISEYTNKIRNSKAVSLYKKAAKTINDLKKKNEQKIKKVRNNLMLLQKIYQDGTKLYNQSKALTLSLRAEFDAMKQEIKDLQQSIQEQVDQKKQGVGNIKDNIRSSAASTLNKAIPTQPNISLSAQGIQSLSQDKIQSEITKQKNYFESLNMGDFANLGAAVMTQTKCNFATFKEFFEKRNNNIKQYVGTVLDIEAGIKRLMVSIQTLSTGVSGKKLNINIKINITSIKSFLENRVRSMKDLIEFIIRLLEPKIKKIKDWVKEKINQVKTYLKTQLLKFAENIKKFAENMIPIQSIIQDIKDKKAYIESKIQIVKDKIAKIKKILKKVSYMVKMTRGFTKLISNIAGGKLKFSENNQAINDTLDGYYGFKMEDQHKSVVIQLTKEKQLVLDKCKTLIIIETLGYGLLETFKDMKNSGFKDDLKETIKNMTNSPAKNTLTQIQSLATNPPKNPKAIKDLADTLGTGVLNDINVASQLVDLERRHLQKSREFIKTVCDVKGLEKTKHYTKITRVKDYLEKNQSFLIVAFELIKNELAAFLSFIDKKIREVINKVMDFLKEKRKKLEEAAKIEIQKWTEKKINIEAPIMSFCFQLASTMFWAGASWVGPTGSTHITTTLGPFKPIKAKTTDGASKMIKEIAKSFETQLKTLQGLIIAPPPQGIPPVPWVGYT
jgi:hypothetical protein